jgi:MFS family permease
MKESPMYSALKKEGKTSVNPLRESFGHRSNFKMVLLALFGAVMGQGVIWYTGQFYAQSFLENTVKIEFMQNREILLWAIALATPFFLFFGWLSDKVGRKWIMLTGMLLGVLFYRPIFSEFLKDADVSAWAAQSPSLLNAAVQSDTTFDLKQGLVIVQHREELKGYEGNRFVEKRHDTLVPAEGVAIGAMAVVIDSTQFLLRGIPDSKPAYSNIQVNDSLKWKFIFLVWVMIIFVTMVYGPIAAFLVELFPTKIRYTSMSLPYHIGNGVFGGLVPFIATLLSATFTDDPLVGLWYPIGVAALCFVIGALYLSNKTDENVND